MKLGFLHIPSSSSSCQTTPPELAPSAPRRAPRGSSLVEVLVVTGLVGTLGGITLTAVSKAKQESKQAVAKKEVRGLVDAIESYQETYGRLPASKQLLDSGPRAR